MVASGQASAPAPNMQPKSRQWTSRTSPGRSSPPTCGPLDCTTIWYHHLLVFATTQYRATTRCQYLSPLQSHPCCILVWGEPSTPHCKYKLEAQSVLRLLPRLTGCRHLSNLNLLMRLTLFVWFKSLHFTKFLNPEMIPWPRHSRSRTPVFQSVLLI